MVEGGIVGESSNASASTSSRLTSSFVKIGDRTRFTVELRPAETTIVSWKKLMKDAAKAEGAAAAATAAAATAAAAPAVVAAPQPPPNALPALESRLSPGQPAANELNDAPAPNRFSAVIEKIERLYTGKDSSDDEDLADVPDDDQYDTEDSFIDDAELDEYFEVDKSKTKHDGYFVNRGTLEKVEPVESATQQPKKRRRKEVAKAPGDSDGQRAIKNLKVGKKGAGKSASAAEKDVLPALQGPNLKSSEDLKLQNLQKSAADSKLPLDPSPSRKTLHVDTSSALAGNSDKHKTGVILAKSPSSKLKEASENGVKIDSFHKTQSFKPTHIEGSESVTQQKDKSGIRERIDLNLPDTRQTIQPLKTLGVNKKEGSSVKSKANVLEKAIRELEKMVAESRPPAPDAQDADSSGQAIKRRLPREIKQKLAKVARLSHASNGKVSNELLNRLMGILGHLIQVRTLKRHLKIMMTMSVSAKQEKDDKFQLTKKEVIEMIKTRIPSLMSKAAEQQSGPSGDIHESGHPEKPMKGQLCMDTTLEDKICDLYDIFIDGLDEDATPQVRKLYAELAELWPKGVMDNHGIKRAICRAKERKRAQNEKNKDHEKARRKKVPAVNAEETVRVESTSAVQSQYVDVRMVSDPIMAVSTQQNRFPTTTSSAPLPAPAPATATVAAVNPTSIASSVSMPSTDVFAFESLKQEKAKATPKSSQIGGKIVDMSVKKKVKKKAENLMGELPLRPEKLSSHQGDDRQKQHKHAAASQYQNVPVTQFTMNSNLTR